MGFSDAPLSSKSHNREDAEADATYSLIDEYMDTRRKQGRLQGLKKTVKQQDTPAQYFAFARAQLKNVTAGLVIFT